MMKIALAFIVLLAMSSAKDCSSLLTDFTVYPTTNENFNLPMSSIFTGSNLIYSETNAPDTTNLYQ